MRADLDDLIPRDANPPVTAEQTCQPAGDRRTAAQDRGAAQNRDDLEPVAGPTFEGNVVDLAATAAVGVEQLAIKQRETEVKRAAQFWPTFVRIKSGTAAMATTAMTTR